MNSFFQQAGSNAFKAIAHFLDFARIALLRLIGLSEPHSQADFRRSDIQGGDFNYRTERFDDGTDPAGWYEPD